MTRLGLGALATLALSVASSSAAAQGAVSPGVQPAIRADLVLGHPSAVQAGVGLEIPAGAYVRVGAGVAAGLRTGPADGSPLGGRVDLLGRFLLDPYRQSRYGFSAGAGLSARIERGQRTTPLLLVALDVEEHYRGDAWVRALQLGLGGGVRVGVVLRRAEGAAR